MIKKQQLYKALFAACMLFGSSAVFAQVKIGTNPSTINAANNLEVEASTAGNKVSVDKTTGKVTIADGSQGDGKLFTSDANGVGTWQPPAGTVIVTGLRNSPVTVPITTVPNGSLTPDCPITLNKGTYQLYYYAQYDYTTPPNPATVATLATTWPSFFYFEFVVASGAATFPSYYWIVTSQNNGPHVIPTISYYQAAGEVQQLVVVTADNTVIKPRYFSLSRTGNVQNIAAIVAVKL
ncbi:hypothetical protein [Dyadobacter sp. CY356]|uniref:hypothetical protein n=1 Tax=Dyadobacter sp. CY356 TaxID=2906442 RepID=UPI001F34B405|nr:hypothetical protein [Dyadobacter sp. CY356]MCF0054852.1 hypothetical protein [Dyadobacter sp. CY356]